MACRRAGPATQSPLEAARHLCQEARAVLTSLRGGPPAVARGELAQDLQDLRAIVKIHLETPQPPSPTDGSAPAAAVSLDAAVDAIVQEQQAEDNSRTLHSNEQQAPETLVPPPTPVDEEDGAVLVQKSPEASPMPTSKICSFSVDASNNPRHVSSPQAFASQEHVVGMFARPFLAVVMDPRAAGPHTLVALRALFRLLERGSLAPTTTTTITTSTASTTTQGQQEQHGYHVSLEPLMKGVLACRFEQTDAGADEAVEMAIADLLALLVNIDQGAFLPATLMEAFNTVFVTRNTFVHSPALCYHFEDVLATMVLSIFSPLAGSDDSADDETACLILEFLVNQMLHTPLVGSSSGGGYDTLDEAAREAQAAHDATRVLCLRLTRCCLRTGYGRDATVKSSTSSSTMANAAGVSSSSSIRPPPLTTPSTATDEAAAPSPLHHHQHHPWEDRSLLSIVQDDLCLSLLMTGQAIWAYHDANSTISPGLISLDVLSEICATISTLWNTVSLRQHLIPQFEQIFTGFYQRALVLLRKRINPTDSTSFHANLVFDSEVEIILESLVDLLGLHEPGHGHASGDAGALEALFLTYDCNLSRSDVASELVTELCRCCGGVISDEGDVMLGVFPNKRERSSGEEDTSSRSSEASQQVKVEYWRQVPAHLKELCAEALVGCMKCLFEDEERGKDDRSKMIEETKEDDIAADSSLRSVHSRKRAMRRAATLFNEKSKKGIEFLVSSGLVSDPVTPMDVALFLRNGLVVGLDKAAVGMYLGELGKAAAAGKSPQVWERDWFHKEVLSAYCSLFRFEGQSLLDGLRMFLAAFRLPGEGQQIDRIIQAFADSCGRTCDESARLKLFSDTPERASDPAFLLSYSIIMLNTDQHNKNIREDRKMSLEAFIRNNTNYGRDITEPGKELPRDFLTSIYESIGEQEIITEGEGADGNMTVERWKDVLRGSAGEPSDSASSGPLRGNDCVIEELVVENLWMPIVSVVGAFWGVVGVDEDALEATASFKNGDGNQNAMLGAQGARLGLDMALDLLLGALNMGRLDIFQQIFTCMCFYTGLLGEYSSDAVERTWSFVNSVGAQSAVIAVVKAARAAGDDIGVEGWMQVWYILFELRDLKLLCGGKHGIITETDPDLLVEAARRDWVMYMLKGGVSRDANQSGDETKGVGSVFGVVGRALFGSEQPNNDGRPSPRDVEDAVRSVHGKEELLLWDELAPSDTEDEIVDSEEEDSTQGFEGAPDSPRRGSAGVRFESQLIHEDMLIQDQTSMPVTGLERIDDTIRFQISPRARVRKRLFRACDFAGLLSESRFMDIQGIEDMLRALSDLNCKQPERVVTPTSDATEGLGGGGDATEDDRDLVVTSPGSEAFAEVLICEIALKNRDRLGTIWQRVLRDHFDKRLGQGWGPVGATSDSDIQNAQSRISPGIEKCVTGLLRICACAVMRDNVGNDVLTSLSLVCPSGDDPRNAGAQLGRHVGEGLWRICRNVDGLGQLSDDSWCSLLEVAEWCAVVGGHAEVDHDGRGGLASDDPALLSYRSLHLLLHSPELKDVIPFSAVRSIRAVIIAGERSRFPKLNIAGLDLLHALHSSVEARAPAMPLKSDETGSEIEAPASVLWTEGWLPVLEAIAEAGRLSMFPDVREHAVSMLTDAFLDKNALSIPPEYICKALQNVCVPAAGMRLSDLLKQDDRIIVQHMDSVMIEIELFISLIYKPLLHHLKRILNADADLFGVWSSLLAVMEVVLANEIVDESIEDDGELVDSNGMTPDQLRRSTKELATEHLRNALMVLAASDVLRATPESARDISAVTWESISKMEFCKDQLDEWKNAASQ